jgi:hypothetical protein
MGDARARRLFGRCLLGAPLVWVLTAPLPLTAMFLLMGRGGTGRPMSWLIALLLMFLPLVMLVPLCAISREVVDGLSGRALNPILGRVASQMGRFAALLAAVFIAYGLLIRKGVG